MCKGHLRCYALLFALFCPLISPGPFRFPHVAEEGRWSRGTPTDAMPRLCPSHPTCNSFFDFHSSLTFVAFYGIIIPSFDGASAVSDGINNCQRCKAVVNGNVRSFVGRHLAGVARMRSPLFVFPTGRFSQPPLRYEGRSSLLVPQFVSVRKRQGGAPFRPFWSSLIQLSKWARMGRCA